MPLLRVHLHVPVWHIFSFHGILGWNLWIMTQKALLGCAPPLWEGLRWVAVPALWLSKFTLRGKTPGVSGWALFLLTWLWAPAGAATCSYLAASFVIISQLYRHIPGGRHSVPRGPVSTAKERGLEVKVVVQSESISKLQKNELFPIFRCSSGVWYQ